MGGRLRWHGRVGRRGRLSSTRGVRRLDLLALDDVPEGTMQMAWADGTDPVIVVHSGGVVRAYQGICTHEYFELDKGFLTGGGSSGTGGEPAGTLTCALHLSRFDLATSEALDPPAELPLAMYPVVVEGGRIILELPEGPIPVNE